MTTVGFKIVDFHVFKIPFYSLHLRLFEVSCWESLNNDERLAAAGPQFYCHFLYFFNILTFLTRHSDIWTRGHSSYFVVLVFFALFLSVAVVLDVRVCSAAPAGAASLGTCCELANM